jgi:hypothetical protein
MVVARFPTVLLIAFLSLMLSACGGSGGETSSSSSGSGSATEAEADVSTVNISGYAVKGVISEGIITAWGLEPDGSLVQLGESVRTNESGFYDLALPAGHDLIKLQLSSDGNTRMRCDAVDGCQDYGGTGTADFGEDFWPGPSLRLETMVALNGDTAQPRGHLTPLTTLSTTLFERADASDGWAGFQQAQRQVETRFGLQAGAVGFTPVDITRELPAELALADLEAALVNSAFLGLAEQFPIEGVQGVIDAYREQLLSAGVINDEDANDLPGSDRIREYAAVHAYTLADSEVPATADTLVLAAERLFGPLDDTDNNNAEPDQAPVAGTGDNNLTAEAPDSAPEPEQDVSQEPAPEPEQDVVQEPAPEPEQDVVQEPAPEPEPVTATATLTWHAPLNREDGTSMAMGEIDQYIVRYGTQSDAEEMTNEIIVEDGQTMTYELPELGEGTWYFAMRTVDQNGLQSAWSEVANKTVTR